MEATPHLLLVDDDPGVCRALKYYFGRHGYRITSASSGEEALRLLDHEAVSLVIVDLNMPGMSGLELLSHIRELHPNLPSIVFTGLGFDEAHFQEAREKGAAGYLSKGLPLVTLLMELHRVLNYRSEQNG